MENLITPHARSEAICSIFLPLLCVSCLSACQLDLLKLFLRCSNDPAHGLFTCLAVASIFWQKPTIHHVGKCFHDYMKRRKLIRWFEFSYRQLPIRQRFQEVCRDLRVKVLANCSCCLECFDEIDGDRTRLHPGKQVVRLAQIVANHTPISSHHGGHEGMMIDGMIDRP